MASAAPGRTEVDVRPSVAPSTRGVPGWMLGLGAVAAGALLFVALESRRLALNAPSVRPRAADGAGGAAPPAPALYIPPEIVAAPPVPAPAPTPTPAPPPQIPYAPPPPPQIVYVPQPQQAPEASLPPQRVANSPTLVVDSGNPAAAGEAGEAAVANAAAAAAAGSGPSPSVIGARARAGAFANRATTIVQGTLIPAVLESALDSTRPGLARAIVSRDVRGFDASRVLIPRGSRLIGEYRSDTAAGQKRALVNWVRLIRPDGATIAIGSPAADTLGGTGIRARVNDHFFERFTGAILQSALDVGVNLAAAEAGGPVVVALPGVAQSAAGQSLQPQQITPTLTVRQGTSISVFVARDLDFTGVESRK